MNYCRRAQVTQRVTHDINKFIHDIHIRNQQCVWQSLCIAPEERAFVAVRQILYFKITIQEDKVNTDSETGLARDWKMA